MDCFWRETGTERCLADCFQSDWPMAKYFSNSRGMKVDKFNTNQERQAASLMVREAMSLFFFSSVSWCLCVRGNLFFHRGPQAPLLSQPSAAVNCSESSAHQRRISGMPSTAECAVSCRMSWSSCGVYYLFSSEPVVFGYSENILNGMGGGV